MIDGYKFRDGKVIVVDYDKNNVKTEIEREYQDNIGELLVAETVGRHLSEKKNKVSEDIQNGESKIEYYKKSNENLVPLIIIMTTAIGSFVCSIFQFLGWDIVLSCLISYLGSNIILDSMFLIPNIVKIENLKKEIKGSRLTLEGIEDEIKRNQKELRRLENDDKVVKEDIKSDYVQLDCEEKIEEIDNNLKLWQYVGVNEEKYLCWYREGVLDEELVEGKCLTLEDVKTLKRIVASRVKKR